MQNQITINELVADLKAELKRVGYADSTTLLRYMGCAGCIAKYFNGLGLTFYDPAVTEEFIQIQKEWHEKGEISGFYYRIRSTAHRLNEIYMTEMTERISVIAAPHVSRYHLNAEHSRLLDLFLEKKQYGTHTQNG